ncbi:hypothetical protein B7P43_G16515 [Cryptotermes secundus]|uniref:Cytochrome P450 9e2 n=1 Tax=Cryptotermes secundus TaxID=105785 RepID=A0A2J7QR70_9NEOP|nr:hypothetical protein B7P43_G16515 [Cryptotermes secundus]
MSTREEKGIVRPDMIHLLMQTKKGTLQGDDNGTTNVKSTNTKWDDDDITAQAFLFFLAGFDTASTLLCFAWMPCIQIFNLGSNMRLIKR